MNALLSILAIFLAGLGPALLGFSRVRPPVPLVLVVATAWFLGAGSIVLSFYLISMTANGLLSAPATTISLAFSLACGLAWWHVRVKAERRAEVPGLPRWQKVIGTAAILLALINLGLAGGYAVITPFVSWDAWTHWILIARHWVGQDAISPLMGLAEWLDSPPGEGRFVISWNSPVFLPVLVTWSADLAGGWDECQLSALWPATNVAIVLCTAGWLRWRAVNWAGCAVGGYVASGIPMIVAHTALAGYADIWLAGAFLVACTVGAVANDDRRCPVLLLVICALAILIIFIKPAGMVWNLIVLGALLAAPLSWPRIAGVGALGAGTILVAGLLGVELFGLSLNVSGVHDVSGPFVRILLLYPDWQMLVPLFMLAVAVACLGGASDGETTLALAAASGIAFAAAALALTRYGAAADTLTLVNRTIMPAMLPLTVFGCSVLCSRFFRRHPDERDPADPTTRHLRDDDPDRAGPRHNRP